MAALIPRQYDKLVADSSRLSEHARHTVITAYWEIGKRIIEEEQSGKVKAPYGERLLIRLERKTGIPSRPI